MIEFTVLAIIIIIFFTRKKKKPTQQKQQIHSQKTTQQSNNVLLKKEIKTYSIKGIEHYLQPTKNNEGFFVGYATTEYNKYDKYAITIYANNKKIGHTPKNNRRLHQTINTHYNGKIIAWGYLEYSNHFKNWYYNNCEVYIPINYTKEEIELIEEYLKLSHLQTPKEETSEEALKKLKIIKHLNVISKQLKSPNHFPFIPTDKTIIKTSILLSKEKEWQKLLDFAITNETEIKQLQEKNKNALTKRISKAKEKLTPKDQ